MKTFLQYVCASVALLFTTFAAAGAGFDHALEFDGVGASASPPSVTLLNTLDYLTAEIHFKTDEARDQNLISHGYGSGHSYGLGWQVLLLADGETVRLGWQTRHKHEEYDFTLPQAYTNGQWHHLAVSGDGEQVEVFYDGVSLGTREHSGRLHPRRPAMVFGANIIASGGYFKGKLAEARIWRVARTADQITADRNRRLFGDEPGLVGYWPMNDGSGTTAADLTSNGNDFTLTATQWVETDVELSSFVVADPVTGNRDFIHTNEAGVVRFPEPPGYNLYRVTQSNTPPTGGWNSTNPPPTSLSVDLPATPGDVTLYAWFTNSAVSVPLCMDSYSLQYLEEAEVTSVSAGGGAVQRDPDPIGDVFALGTELTLTAQADPDHHFLYWEGDLPPGAYPTDNPLEFTVDQERALTAVFTADSAPVRIWTGGGGNNLADTAANWTDGVVPQSGESVFFGFTPEGARTECTWNLTVAVSNWTQTTDFPGIVTFETVYPESGSFSNMVITGDCVIEGGAWTHTATPAGDTAVNRLAATVGGSFTLADGAMIDLLGRGFGEQSGPGAGRNATRQGRAASHGGAGAYHTVTDPAPSPCYGDAVSASTLGSGGRGAGGGVLDLDVAGMALIDGLIDVDGQRSGNNYQQTNPGDSGGSIRVRASSIEGTGRLSARGSVGYYTGGGGRISLTATNSGTIGEALRMSAAAGGYAWSRYGSAGTIYLKSTASERLILDGLNINAQAEIATDLPASLAGYPIHPAVGGPMENATLILTNAAQSRMTRSLRLGDFAWIDETSSLDLNTFTLYLKADEPAGAFPGDYGNGTIVSNGGEIIWGDATANFLLLTSSGLHGSVSRDPDSPDDLYEIGTDVTITAFPDSGYRFIWWRGDLPEGVDRTDNPLELSMDQRYEIKALFALDDPDTCSWTGEGADAKAGTPENWYPIAAPVSGKDIRFDGISVNPCEWDLDIQPASWTQTTNYPASWSLAEGYKGWVELQIRYPGFGGFSNLTITGDVDLQGGTWTHPYNSGDHDATDRLWITIGGNFTLGSQASINLFGQENKPNTSGANASRGFANMRGPGAGSSGARNVTTLIAASHGGRGEYGSEVQPASCYGSFAAPETLGSGAGGYVDACRGGGAVRLDVGGLSMIEGVMDARSNSTDYRYPGPAGGSIWLTTGSLTGEGILRADASVGYVSGGGGRVSVVLTESEDFGNVGTTAYGGEGTTHPGQRYRGSAGTVYRKGATGRATLIVDNRGYESVSPLAFTELYDDGVTDLYDVTLIVRNGGRVGIMEDNLRIFALEMDASSTLLLQGYNLVVRTPYPREGIAGTIVEDGGSITWTPTGSLILVK